MIWREKRVMLIVLGALLLANLLFFVTYRVRYEQRVRELETRLEQSRVQLDQGRRARASSQRKLEGYRKLVADIQIVYDEMWSTPDERLTALISEVKRLVAASQLVSNSYGYTTSKGDAKMGTQAMAITFSVRGPYRNLRELINLLELSRQFVSIDSISIASSGTPDGLNMRLQLRTVFRDQAGPVKKEANRGDV